MRTATIFIFIILSATFSALAQAVDNDDDVSKGHHLAIMLCADCHVVGSDQPYPPTLDPPAPSFRSIAQRPATTFDSVRSFLMSASQQSHSVKGMPNPMLAEFQIKAIAAYLLSLRR
jgi:mono/diheme cytochrome c family protein